LRESNYSDHTCTTLGQMSPNEVIYREELMLSWLIDGIHYVCGVTSYNISPP